MRHARRRLLVFLGLGLLSSVAVAWVSVLVVDPTAGPCAQRQTGGRTPGPVWVVRLWSAPTATFVCSQRFVATSAKRENAGALVPYWSGFDAPERHRDPDHGGARLYESVAADARGWPLRALRSEIRDPYSARREVRWGYEIPRGPGPRAGRPGPRPVLPLRPIPLGLLANAALVAAVLYAPFIPLDARRLRRWRRRQCLRCGYPIGGSPLCTECGKPLAARPVIVGGRPAASRSAR